VSALEAELEEPGRRIAASQPEAEIPWWERRFASFQDDPWYVQASELGREQRQAMNLLDDERA
jgi:hypothetical protein